ncbi:MAG: hypothetical protein LBP51_06115 [Deferribacteraceae bacterium]|nr:hypothetical protein [Deferribacteraceae bacterium]
MEKFDPMHLLGVERYNSLIAFITNALTNGILARVLSAALLILALWFVWRRKQVPMGMVLIALSVGFVFIGMVL